MNTLNVPTQAEKNSQNRGYKKALYVTLKGNKLRMLGDEQMIETLPVPLGYKIIPIEGKHYPMYNLHGEWYYFSVTIKDDFTVVWHYGKKFTSWRRAYNFVNRHYEAGLPTKA